MADEGAVVVFLAEFDHQVEEVSRLYSILEGKLAIWTGKTVGAEQVESAGYWLHNLYCAFEDLFKLVAAFFENSLPADGAFHLSLLKRMLLKIDQLRPPLISHESYAHLNELRGFRHIFRHAYTFGLDDERVLFLLRRVSAHKGALLKDLRGFRESVDSIRST